MSRPSCKITRTIFISFINLFKLESCRMWFKFWVDSTTIISISSKNEAVFLDSCTLVPCCSSKTFRWLIWKKEDYPNVQHKRCTKLFTFIRLQRKKFAKCPQKMVAGLGSVMASSMSITTTIKLKSAKNSYMVAVQETKTDSTPKRNVKHFARMYKLSKYQYCCIKNTFIKTWK